MNSSSAHSRSRAGTAGRKGAKGSRKGANGEGRAFIDETQDASEAAGANPNPPGKRSYADVVRAGRGGRGEGGSARKKSPQRVMYYGPEAVLLSEDAQAAAAFQALEGTRARLDLDLSAIGGANDITIPIMKGKGGAAANDDEELDAGNDGEEKELYIWII